MDQEPGPGAVLAHGRTLGATAGGTAIAGAFRRLAADLLFGPDSSTALSIASAVSSPAGVVASLPAWPRHRVAGRNGRFPVGRSGLPVGGGCARTAGACRHRGSRLVPRPKALRRWWTLGDRCAFADLSQGFITWKSGTLLWEAWTEGQVSQSTWWAPMRISDGIMTLGARSSRLRARVASAGEVHLRAVSRALRRRARSCSGRGRVNPLLSRFTPAAIGIAYCMATLLVMFSGMPIAFALGAVATAFMIFFMPPPRRYGGPECLRGDGESPFSRSRFSS